jgi:excisionase family DNA binding protein
MSTRRSRRNDTSAPSVGAPPAADGCLADSAVAVRRDIGDLVASLKLLAGNDLPAALGQLEELRARLWLKMLVPAPIPSRESSQSKLMTVAEVAHILRFSRGHVYELVRSGDLQAIKNGRAVRITDDALAGWHDRHGRPPLDGAYSVSLDSNGDRRPGKARPRDNGTNAARVRETARCPSGDRRQMGDGRSRYPRAGSEAHGNSRRRRHDGEPEERPAVSREATQREDAPER